jgi:glutaredoxin-related protein
MQKCARLAPPAPAPFAALAARPAAPRTLAAPPATRRAPAHAAPARAAASRRPAAAAAAAPDAPSYAAAPALPAASPEIPASPGVYAVLDAAGTLQYVGLSRKISVSVAAHADALPDKVSSVKVLSLPAAGREELTDAWKAWVSEAVEATGAIPPGNAPGAAEWTARRPRAARAELRLTPGKGLADLTVSVEALVDQVVKSARVVAFVKGTRTEPACGFSHKVLSILTEVAGGDFEVVNVLDEVYNPGLRDAIKAYSQWPTIPQVCVGVLSYFESFFPDLLFFYTLTLQLSPAIPQVYVGGEFVGGADIVEEQHASGELRAAVAAARAAGA